MVESGNVHEGKPSKGSRILDNEISNRDHEGGSFGEGNYQMDGDKDE